MTRVSSSTSTLLPYLAVFFFLCFLCAQVQAQTIERFVISTRGSFRQDANAGGNEVCTYCNCVSGTCNWVDNFTCTQSPEYEAFGADDNQQRWGTASQWNCFAQSGVGFQGVSNVEVYSNVDVKNITRIGRITHYNNVIDGGSPSRLRLTLTVTSPQLQQPFVIAYPLQFIETDNTNSLSSCDPAIQRTNRTCDDRFSFEKLSIDSSFVFNNIQYTLQAVGFLNAEDLNTPLKQFVTREESTSRADIYARIVTFCLESECPANQVFQTTPTCGCVCGLTEEICREALTEDWGFDNNTCDCVCRKNETTACGPLGVLNTASCGCDCNVTEAYCAALNPLYGVALAPVCGCDCKRQKYLDCYAQNPFYVPDKNQACGCVCQISDGICEQTYGSGFTADFATCLCVPPGGDGLSGGDIAGIVIGSLAGAAILLLLMFALAGILVWLIRSGKIPGIYGYKIDAADLSAAQESPFYKDVWAGNTNAMAE